MNELRTSLHHVRESIAQVSMLSKDVVCVILRHNSCHDYLSTMAESIDILLVHANQLVIDGISMLIPSSSIVGSTIKGAAASLIARAMMRRLMAKITIMRVIKLLLVLLFMAVSPAPQPNRVAHAHHDDDTDTDDDDTTDVKSSMTKKKVSQSHQSLLMAAVTETPELAKEMLTLGRTYWRLATRIASLISTMLHVTKQHSKNWSEISRLVVRLASITDASSSLSSKSSDSIINRIRDGLLSRTTLHEPLSAASHAPATTWQQFGDERSLNDIVSTASRPPFARLSLRSSL